MYKLFPATVALSALLATSLAAHAADMRMPVKAPPAPPPPPFSWTGIYIGGNIGGAWGRRNLDDDFFGLDFGNDNNNGVFIGGGQLGFNYQINNFVWGVEGDFDWAANNNNSEVLVGTNVGTFRVTSNDNNSWIATVAARLGVAYDRWLFYVKGGGGWVGNHDFTITNIANGASLTISNNNNNGGWLVGGGIEWAFGNNWSAKIEYDYLGLSNRTFVVPVGSPFLVGDTFNDDNRNVQMVKVGLNYRFDWGSPPSPVTTGYLGLRPN